MTSALLTDRPLSRNPANSTAMNQMGSGTRRVSS
jgi:hypothetical protein